MSAVLDDRTTLHVADLAVELDAESGIVRAIDSLALTIARGQTFALVGESGCGKSMTALALMRLLPENGQITAGQVDIGDTDVLALPESAMRGVRGGRIGMIFQEPSTSLNPVMRVGEQIVEAIAAHTPLRGKAARAKAIDWLRRVGIPEPERRIDDYPFRMSGGQKQRVMIAIALAAEPDFLIADEPTTALDVTIQAQILDLLKDLQREQGMGLLLITHDLAVVSGMADQVALMYAGQIIELAAAADFFAAPRHPYAQALLRALPDARHRDKALAAIAGSVPALNRPFAGCRFAPRCAFAQASCELEVPALRSIGAGQVRCHRVDDGGQLPAPNHAEPAPVSASRVAATGLSDAAPLLRVEGLRVSFPIRRGMLQRQVDHFVAVDGVSFEVAAGRTLALVGESGCGKTTTGKAIVQLLRRQANIEGRALLSHRWAAPEMTQPPRGEAEGLARSLGASPPSADMFALSGDALQDARRKVQIIFQDPYASLNPRMRVAEILEEGIAALQPGTTVEERRQRIARITDQVGLRPDALARFPHEFSGGQRQRIAIARALAVQPQLIVCDEPTSALDVSVQAQILNLLRELQRELGVAYLFITHNIGVVEYVADDVAVMQAGRIIEQGPTASVLGAPQRDYTRRLLAAVPRLCASLATG